MRNFCKKLVRGFNNLVDYISVIGMIVTFILVMINVIARYASVDANLSWAEEAARYMFILVCCFGLLKVTRTRDHFSVTMLTEKMPMLLANICKVVSDIIMMILMGVLVAGGIEMIGTTLNNRSSAMGMPTWILYGLLVFSAAGMFLSMIKILIEDILGKCFDSEECGEEEQ